MLIERRVNVGEFMELDERKLKILEAIISNYLSTAEPVGSRTISKNYDLGVSPATIRNEMSDLEELGFILQPHTSSGRIPSDKGYRLYVDKLMSTQMSKMVQIEQMNSLIASANRIENLLMEIANVLAERTNLTAVVSKPRYERSAVKKVSLILVDVKKVLAVIVTEGNVASNFIFDIEHDIRKRQLDAIAILLNEKLKGLEVDQINLPIIEDLKSIVGEHVEVVNKVLEAIFKSVQNKDGTDIYTSGTLNVLKSPEFRDFEKATRLIEAFEKKDTIKSLLLSTEYDESETGDKITVRIGSENGVELMKDCSLITTSYHINGKPLGIIGVIGPKRMDYENVIKSLKCLIKDIESKINST